MIKNLVIILLTGILLMGAKSQMEKPKPLNVAINSGFIYVLYSDGSIVEIYQKLSGNWEINKFKQAD